MTASTVEPGDGSTETAPGPWRAAGIAVPPPLPVPLGRAESVALLEQLLPVRSPRPVPVPVPVASARPAPASSGAELLHRRLVDALPSTTDDQRRHLAELAVAVGPDAAGRLAGADEVDLVSEVVIALLAAGHSRLASLMAEVALVEHVVRFGPDHDETTVAATRLARLHRELDERAMAAIVERNAAVEASLASLLGRRHRVSAEATSYLDRLRALWARKRRWEQSTKG